MARRLFIPALAVLLSVFSASAADIKFFSCQTVWLKVTVDGPIALKGDLQLEAGGGGDLRLEPEKIEIKHDRVTCQYRNGNVTARYSYKIPPGRYCKDSRRDGPYNREFEVTCFDRGSR